MGLVAALCALLLPPSLASADLDSAAALYESERWDLAVPMMRDEAEGGAPQAAFWLGVMLAEGGHGVVADPSQGVMWLTRAAEAGHAGAKYELYVHYSAVSPNVAERRRWAEAVARDGADADGVQQAQAVMAAIDLSRLNAFSAPPDMPQAAMWLGVAAELGDAPAKAELDTLMPTLPEDAQRAVRRAVLAWKAGDAFSIDRVR
jgi:uncharacterized protein